MKVATNAMCHPQTKKPKVKKLKLLFEKASLIASIAVWLLSFVLSDEIFGVVTKNATISPAPIKKINNPQNEFIYLKDKNKIMKFLNKNIHNDDIILIKCSNSTEINKLAKDLLKKGNLNWLNI